MILENLPLEGGVALPAFPCTLVEFSSPVNSVQELLKRWNDERPSSDYLLVSHDAIQSDEQAWSAWLKMKRSHERGGMLARSKDVEFLRLISGTHHIDQAFKRAGVAEGDQSAWVVLLPEVPDGCQSPSSDLIDSMGWTSSDIRPKVGSQTKLGIDSDSGDSLSDLIVHVVSADFGQ